MTPISPLSCEPTRNLAPQRKAQPVTPADVSLEPTFSLRGQASPEIPEATRAEPAPPPEFLGDYRILREIGRGGMGVVYEAEQFSLGRRVALKVLAPQVAQDPDSLERFRREARAAAGLHHTNIVPVFEVGREGDVWFYAMQFIDGSSLERSQGFTAGNTTRYRDLARLGEQIAEALAYAHARGVIHRDIKPSNLLLDGNGVAWVTDFGLAKPTGDNLTRPGDLFGTLAYMAPERFRGESDGRTDIYALGLTLYELILGRPAFESSDHIEAMHQVQHCEPPPPRTLDPHLPRDLETILLKCTEKDPGRRYRNAEELAEDLRRFQADEPIRARPVGPLQRLVRAARRNPRMATLIVAVCALTLLLVVGAVLAALSFHRLARDEHAQAQAARLARSEAETQARIAVEQAETLKETSVFLLGLLEETDPLALSGRGFGPKLGAIRLDPLRLLDQASAKLRTTLREKPGVRASLLGKIGSVYVSFGRFASAGNLLNEALDLRLKLHSGDHADVAESWHQLGFFHLAQTHIPDAEKCYGKALAMRTRLFGENHPLVGETLMYLGITHTIKHSDDAEKMLLRAQDIQSRKDGTSREYAMTVVALIQHYYVRGATAKMMALLPEADHLIRELTGNEEPAAAVRHLFQAQTTQRFGLFEEAARHYREALRLAEPWLGEYHVVAVQTRKQLAHLLHQDLRDLPAAEKEYRHLLDLLERAGRENSSQAADVHLHLGRVFRDAKRFPEAEAHLLRAIETIRKTEGQLARALHILAEIRFRSERWAEAESVMVEAVDLRRTHADGDNFWFGQAVDDLVRIRETLGKVDMAIDTLKTNLPFLDRQKTVDPEFHVRNACRRARLITFLQDRPDQADYLASTRDQAVDSLSQAIQQGYRNRKFLQRSTALEPLRMHPGFADLLRNWKKNS